MQIPSAYPKRRARIEIIPLIDIMFFLLATFIMVSVSMIKNLSLPVNLPSAHTAQTDTVKSEAIVAVTKEGEIFWNKDAVTLEQIPDRLAELLASNSDPKVMIQGDEKADFGTIVSVLDAVRKSGVKRTAIRTKSGTP